MTKERIQYIDAMRGLTMILVIYSHICIFCFKEYFIAFNDILFLLRMPCFFFISGWLFYKIGRVWDKTTAQQVVHNKFMVQIIPTFIFLALHERQNFFHQIGAFKGGYWFTFALFVYFVIYILTTLLFQRFKHKDIWMFLVALLISIAAFWYDVNYHRVSDQLGWGCELLGFLGFVTWRFYIFFMIGVLVRKYFDLFLRLTDRWYVLSGVVIIFILIAVLIHYGIKAQDFTLFLLSGICGIVMVFTFFRKFASWFTKERFIGRGLQYVGTRTLDIYLLHFFFLPESMLLYNRQILVYDNKLLEVAIVMGEALVVLAVCLTVSRLLRLSPFLAHYLFGVRDK